MCACVFSYKSSANYISQNLDSDLIQHFFFGGGGGGLIWVKTVVKELNNKNPVKKSRKNVIQCRK